MITNYSIKLGDMINRDFRTAGVFLEYHIDLKTECNKTIEAVCKDNDINLLHLMNDLNEVLSSGSNSIDYSLWPLSLLTNLIVVRLRYAKEDLSIIQHFLISLSGTYKGYDQQIFKLWTDFNACVGKLIATLQKQVLILFTAVQQMIPINEATGLYAERTFETARFGMVSMNDELSMHKKAFLTVVNLLNIYVSPEKSCKCYKVTMNLLAEFKNDLYKIMGLQNILHSRVMTL